MSADTQEMPLETPPDQPSHKSHNHKPKSSKKQQLWFVGIITFIIVFLGTLLFNVLLPAVNKPQGKAGLAAATHFDSVTTLVNQATADIKGSNVEVTTTDGMGGMTKDGNIAYMSAPFRDGDTYAFYNMPAKSTGAAYKGDSVTTTADYLTLVDFFKKNKFVFLSSDENTNRPITWSNEYVTSVAYSVYESVDAVCIAEHVDATSTPVGGHMASIGCGEKTSYKNAAKSLNQLYEPYVKGNKDVSDPIILGFLASSDGQDGYRNATLYQQEPTLSDEYTKALYYLTPGANSWTYFTELSNILGCSQYTSDTLKKAFHGIDCYNEETKQTVTLQ